MRLQNANADEHPSRIKLSAHVWTAPHLFGNRAGACQISGLNKEDVIIADCIYGYKYGKIEGGFKSRGNWTFKTDEGLMTGAIGIHGNPVHL